MPDPLWRAADDGRPFDLLGLGQISLDRLVQVARLPRAGGKTALLGERQQPGGQVATALLAATQLGLRCALAGAVGDDEEGRQALAPLERAGIDLSRVVRRPGVATRQAVVVVERDTGERTVLERRDPRLALAPDALGPAALGAARVLLLDLEHPQTSQRAADAAQSAGIPVVLDADRSSPEALRLSRSVEFPIVSQGFAEEISSDASLDEQAFARLSGARTRMAVVTCGAQGSVARFAGRLLRTPAPRVPVVDTTGAGDVFRGAFAWALVRGADAPCVLRAANTAAALACRGEGAQGSLPDLAELEAWLEGGG